MGILIVRNTPSSSKSSSSSEYYLPHIFCEGICISQITTPRGYLDNRNTVDIRGEIVLYENPIGSDDAEEYHSTNGEPVLEINTLVPPIIKGCWNFFHQPFPTYWNSESSSESNKDLGNFSNLLDEESNLQRELTQATIVPLSSIVIFEGKSLNSSNEPIVYN